MSATLSQPADAASPESLSEWNMFVALLRSELPRQAMIFGGGLALEALLLGVLVILPMMQGRSEGFVLSTMEYSGRMPFAILGGLLIPLLGAGYLSGEMGRQLSEEWEFSQPPQRKLRYLARLIPSLVVFTILYLIGPILTSRPVVATLEGAGLLHSLYPGPESLQSFPLLEYGTLLMIFAGCFAGSLNLAPGDSRGNGLLVFWPVGIIIGCAIASMLIVPAAIFSPAAAGTRLIISICVALLVCWAGEATYRTREAIVGQTGRTPPLVYALGLPGLAVAVVTTVYLFWYIDL